MAIQYVNTNRQNTTFSPTNKQDLINQIETVLLAAGWTTISGHATTTLVMQSATTPDSLNMQIKLKDNGGTCVAVSLQNVAGTKVGNNSTTAGAQLNPGASTKTYRIVANKYQVFIWTPTPTPAREFAAWGVPALPSFLSGVVTEAMWLQGNAGSDTTATIFKSWRTCLDTVQSGSGSATNVQVCCNGNIWENDNTGGPATGLGFPKLVPASLTDPSGASCFRWHDNSVNLTDALVAWGLASLSAEAMIRGQLWDAMVASGPFVGDLTTTADSHNWIVITDNNNGGTGAFAIGTLFLAIP